MKGISRIEEKLPETFYVADLEASGSDPDQSRDPGDCRHPPNKHKTDFV